MDNLAKIRESILNGNSVEAIKFTKIELEKGTEGSEILEKAMIRAMDQVGQDFSNGKAFLPELIAAGYVMSKAVEVIKAHMPACNVGKMGTIAMGTIFGDVHDIGKNIVKMNFEGAGFNVIDLGTDVPAEAFIKGCKENNAALVGISALLSSTMLNMEAVIKIIRANTQNVKIMVGGHH